MTDERLEADKVLLRNTLVELMSLLDAATSKVDIIMCLESMPIQAAFNLQKSVDTACGIVVMLLAK